MLPSALRPPKMKTFTDLPASPRESKILLRTFLSHVFNDWDEVIQEGREEIATVPSRLLKAAGPRIALAAMIFTGLIVILGVLVCAGLQKYAGMPMFRAIFIYGCVLAIAGLGGLASLDRNQSTTPQGRGKKHGKAE